ncbi:ABC transporter ATP-binding protein [Bacillus sp. AGMB 02131]|uniref:ABC transporter ATP-binding protein n=1 Tax=Peribacillus faecalis TaxID=2772559 RepID=A0A927CUD1_9BACI|nr:ABC transporter ATP-binding protein [Peribacillus faecalis]MBD3107359.1 ABC transporter ATP-binding protein [Peribacillus faecalis]
MEVTVRLDGVTKRIKNKTIIDDLSFDVFKGEIFGFLGPNGAGKTTTIRMIVGLMKMSEGDVFICGESVKKQFEKAIGHIGAIVENPELYKYLSGYDNLKHYARMSSGVNKERIDEVIKLVGLQQRIHDKVKSYSLGMRQRLGLAQALLHNPKVLILDEPTNGLDPQGIREIRDYLKKLAAEEGMTVIVSSHLLSEMEMMCDRFCIIQNGKLVDIQNVHEESEDEIKNIAIEVSPLDQALRIVKEGALALEADIINGRLQLKVDKTAVPKIVKALALLDCEIYSVENVTVSLEEKFLQITGEGGQIA